MSSSHNETASEPNPSPKPRQETVFHFLLMGAAAIIILAGIKAASAIVSPMLLALFLTIILVVPLRWLRKQGCPNSIALILVLGGTILMFSGVSYFLGRSLNDFILRMPAYKNRIVQKLELLDKQLEHYGFVLDETGKEKKTTEFQTPTVKNPPIEVVLPPIRRHGKSAKDKQESDKSELKSAEPNKPDKPLKEVPPPINESPQEQVAPKTDTGAAANDSAAEPSTMADSVPDSIPDSIPDTEKKSEDETENDEKEEDTDEILPVSSEEIAKILDNPSAKTSPSLIALTPESAMYWVTRSLVELRRVVEGGFLVLIFTIFMIFEASRFPEKIDRAFGKNGPINNEHFHRIAADIRRYLFLKAITNVMSAAAATFVYWMFGVPATLFWGVIAYFLYFIPNIGGTMAAILPGMLIFMTYDIQGVLLYALCLVAIECAIAYGIEPKLLGYGLRLSTVVIILSLFSWGWLLGPVGLFLAAPLTIVVKIIFQAFKETEWIAILLDDNRNQRL